jgi:indole-3-glycerol phosphate synthase
MPKKAETGPLAAVLNAARIGSRTALMADIKCRSARDQQLIDPAGIEGYVTSLLNGGIDAMSVVTESKHFGGSLSVAARVRAIAGLPIIRKEFFSRLEQMDESARVGFDAVQLTIRVIGNLDMIANMKQRAEQLGMEVIICIQDENELDQALGLGAGIIGINNRDILSLEIDSGTVSRTEALIASAPDDVFVISESSMLSSEDVRRAASAGSDGVLIGTAFAKAPDPTSLVRQFRIACAR